jgi:hypothetical protein
LVAVLADFFAKVCRISISLPCVLSYRIANK